MNPLDLFSDSAKSVRLDATSSPVTRHHELVMLKQELLSSKSDLVKEIDSLELEMNQLINKEKEETANLRKEEEDLVMRLLLEAEKDAEEVEDDSTQRKIDQDTHRKDIESQQKDEEDDEDEFGKYDAKPSKKWDTRLEYLVKFYPDTKISNVKSSITLEYMNDTKTLVKKISFQLNIKNVIKFEIFLKLNKFKKAYQVFELIPTKLSNNKLNSILLKISEFYKNSKNINLFLLNLNKLYELIKKRQELFNKCEDWTFSNNILNNSMSYKTLTLYYDIMFDNITGELKIVYTTNKSKLNPVLHLFIKSYGIEVGLQKFIGKADVHLSEVITV